MSNLDLILQSIQNGILLGVQTFQNLDVTSTLTARDMPGFENRWLYLFEKLRNTDSTSESKDRVDRIREAAFKTVFQATQDPELSGYVSDDFDLISRGIAANLEDAFLNSLLASYLDGQIPHADIVADGSLNEMIEELKGRLGGGASG